MIVIIIVVIALFKCQVYLKLKHTNWGHCKLKLIECRFLRRGENRSARGKTSQSREENQQTQPTYDAESGNRTRATLVGGDYATVWPGFMLYVG